MAGVRSANIHHQFVVQVEQLSSRGTARYGRLQLTAQLWNATYGYVIKSLSNDDNRRRKVWQQATSEPQMARLYPHTDLRGIDTNAAL